MNKIIRLSVANIRKHKIESVLLAVLIMFCMTLLSSSLSGQKSIKQIFPDMMKMTECWENYVIMYKKNFNDDFMSFLENDEEINKSSHFSFIYDVNTCYLDRNGNEQPYPVSFFTKQNDAEYEHTQYESSLSSEQISALEHPVYMTWGEKESLGLNEGDSFDIIYGTRKFSFTVAGFYESGYWNTGSKIIVSGKDYRVLESVLDESEMIVFNSVKGSDNKEIFKSFFDACKNYSSGDISGGMFGEWYESMKYNFDSMTAFLLNIMKIMALVIIIAVAVMIRFRIVSDIKEQIVSIGVLEALGYKTTDISLSYVIEYLMIALTGVIFGIGGCLILTPFLISFGEKMTGYSGNHDINFLPVVYSLIGLLAFVILIAYIKASSVKKYPPVLAFRKGIENHHFGKTFFPLKKTKKSVNIRLALKEFAENSKQNIGLTFCITVTTVAVVLSFILYGFFGNVDKILNTVCGHELSDIHMEISDSVDTDEFSEKLMEIPEIRKILPTCAYIQAKLIDSDEDMEVNLYRDYSQTENIFLSEGRFPEHDNEIMLSKQTASFNKIEVGDSVTIEYCKISKKYIVSGLVTSMVNFDTIYITEEGFKRLNPVYHPDVFEIYLNKDADVEKFKTFLTQTYGRSIADICQDSSSYDNYEDRIKNEAEKKIAVIMAKYGAASVEYSIQSGDSIISGNSSNFKIKSLTNVADLYRKGLNSLCTPIAVSTKLFMLMSAVVVMIILFVLMESTIRKQRKELGIMKSMGYTSKELMFQLAFMIMPSTFISVCIGTVISVLLKGLLSSISGKISVDFTAVFILDIVILMFCFICAYIGARKIKKISVYELMTE